MTDPEDTEKNSTGRKENADRTDAQDTGYLSETRVLERMTDADYTGEVNRAESNSEKKENDTGYLSETRVLERMTDPDYKEEEKRASSSKEPQKKKKKKEPEEKETSAWKEIRSFLIDLAICIAAVLLITNFLVRPVQVKGSSMYPTLQNNTMGLSNLLGFRMDGLKRFDIAIIYLPEKSEYLVKRVIGLPGETVSYSSGQLYINGEAVEEPFLNQSYIEETEAAEGTFMQDVQPVTLGEDEYFCLGDNRPHSTDSRFYGPFKKDQILSKGVVTFWPLSRLGVHTW